MVQKVQKYVYVVIECPPYLSVFLIISVMFERFFFQFGDIFLMTLYFLILVLFINYELAHHHGNANFSFVNMTFTRDFLRKKHKSLLKLTSKRDSIVPIVKAEIGRVLKESQT